MLARAFSVTGEKVVLSCDVLLRFWFEVVVVLGKICFSPSSLLLCLNDYIDRVSRHMLSEELLRPYKGRRLLRSTLELVGGV